MLQKYLVVEIFCCTFATQLRVATYWTFSSAGLEHLPYKQRVGGSNPSTSTIKQTYRTFSSAGLEHLPYKQRVGGSNPSTSTEAEPAHCVGYFFLLLLCCAPVVLFWAHLQSLGGYAKSGSPAKFRGRQNLIPNNQNRFV